MVGDSAAMQEVFSLIQRLAPHARTTLVTGETGTGKELVARALHTLGPRRTHRLVTVNCSAVVESLFESELFGHVRGAFTGASEHKPGLIELANTGTLFLDEVGELPLGAQAKLLRVLEDGHVQRVGSLEARHVDVRVVAATNRDLLVEVAAGRFRRDLFYRLNVLRVHLPPLRERRDDIPALARFLVGACADRLGKPLAGLTPRAEAALARGGWCGNVRELRNVLERACILADGPSIDEADLEWEAEHQTPLEARPPAPSMFVVPAHGPQRLDEVERGHIARTLALAHGNKAVAARLLGMSRRALYRHLERHGLHHRATPDDRPEGSDQRLGRAS